MKKLPDLAERVYQEVRDLILRYELKPGQRIDLAQTSQRLGVSPTPLREVLVRLTQEGYVSHLPNRGFIVKEITIEEAECLYGIREALEAYAIEVATPRFTPEQWAELASLNEDYHEAVLQARDRKRFLLDRLFHLRIAEASGNFLLVRTLEQVREKINMKIRLEGLPNTRRPIAYHEHLDILGALRAQDPTRAVAVLRRHISSAKEATLQFLRNRLPLRDLSPEDDIV